MTINNLKNSQKKVLARKLRTLIEPDGANSNGFVNEADLRKFLLSEGEILIESMNDIFSILKSNYSSKTFSRLVSKIKRSVVWDTSMCHLPTKELYKLFSDDSRGNIITSLTFDELLKLSQDDYADKEACANAQFLYMSVLEDADSKHFTCIQIPKNGYVDTQLIELCVKNNYMLYTRDKFFTLRARCHHIDVTYFDTPGRSNNIYKYSPLGNDNIILDTDLLESSTNIQDILCTARSMKCGKFILTYEFVELLEKLKNHLYISQICTFFVYNVENTIYLDPNESSGTIVELSKKYNATIFTKDLHKAFKYKCMLHEKFKLVTSSESREFMREMKEKLNLSYNSLENQITAAAALPAASVQSVSSTPSTTSAQSAASAKSTAPAQLATSAQSATPAQSTASATSAAPAQSTASVPSAVSAQSTASVPSAVSAQSTALAQLTASTSSTEKSVSPLVPYADKSLKYSSSFSTTPYNNSAPIVKIGKETNMFLNIPFYFPKDNKLSTRRIPPNQKIWVLDANGSELTINPRKPIALNVNYTVIHGINKLNDSYQIDVYTVTRRGNNFRGLKTFTLAFGKDMIDSIELKYKDFAKRLVLLT